MKASLLPFLGSDGGAGFLRPDGREHSGPAEGWWPVPKQRTCGSRDGAGAGPGEAREATPSLPAGGGAQAHPAAAAPHRLGPRRLCAGLAEPAGWGALARRGEDLRGAGGRLAAKPGRAANGGGARAPCARLGEQTGRLWRGARLEAQERRGKRRRRSQGVRWVRWKAAQTVGTKAGGAIGRGCRSRRRSDKRTDATLGRPGAARSGVKILRESQFLFELFI